MSAAGACLDRESIRRRLDAAPPLLEGYPDLESQLQPNGFDLTLAEVAAFDGPGVLTADNAGRRLAATTPLPFGADGALHLDPGPYLVTLNETINLPLDVMALGKPRSSLLRSGVAMHNAVWDAGYRGSLPGPAGGLPPPRLHPQQRRTGAAARLLPPRPPRRRGVSRPLPGRGPPLTSVPPLPAMRGIDTVPAPRYG